MKKYHRNILLVLVFLFLTAQTCSPSDIAAAIVHFANNPPKIDCTGIVLNPLVQDANGNVTVTWTTTVPARALIKVNISNSNDANGSTYFEQVYAENVTTANFRIDWQSIRVNQLTFFFMTGTCGIQRTLERPSAATATPTATPTSTPTATPTTAAVASMNCSNLRLTSPLGGMANGMQTFYWDALPNAVGYRINVYYGGALLTGWDAPAGQLNLTADVSRAVVGGETPLTVELVARDSAGRTCNQRYEMGREAAAPQNQGAPAAPSETPTCNEDPYRDVCL